MSSKMLVPLTLKIEKISKPRDLNFDQHKPLLKSGVMLSSLTWYMAYLYSMQIGLERKTWSKTPSTAEMQETEVCVHLL